MNLDANDPKWTAYALGEVKDEKERAEMERILEESGEMRRIVEEIRETAGLLKEELLAEPGAVLTQAQRESIMAKSTASRRPWFALKPSWAMACAAVAVMVLSFVAYKQIARRGPVSQETQIASLAQKKTPSPIAGDLQREAGHDTGASRSPNEMPAPAAQLEKLKPPPDRPSDAKQYAVTDNESDKTAPAVGEAAAAAPEPPGATPSLQEPAKLAALKGEFHAPASASEIKVLDSAERSLPEAAVSTETVADAQSPKEQPHVKKDASDLINVPSGVMSGVVVAENPMFSNNEQMFAGVNGRSLDIRRSGIMASEARYPHTPPPFPLREEIYPHNTRDRRFNTEAYDPVQDNDFLHAADNPLSTFSIDVDTASYSNVRRFLQNGSLPPKDAVRIEELVNYFDYDYKSPKDGKPFAAHFELTDAPWNPKHRLLRIGLKGREVDPGKRPDSNLVFLLDVSGSMSAANKLPLVKQSILLLVDRLTESDRVAIVVYSGDAHLYLPSTSGDGKERLRRSIRRLHAGGSTNGASGIQLAYETAAINFIEGGINRVILATDGDFNVGTTNRGDLTRLIEKKAESGIYLSALGFGMGNYKDATLEMLADKGRGNYAYIDTINEAKKVLVEQINSTLVAIAKDVKVQVEFNPRRVGAYRLIGYEDRIMTKEDFNDDAKKAGVIGAGHAVTALYELVPPEVYAREKSVDPLKYQKPAPPAPAAHSDEIATVKIRSKDPEKDKSVLSEFVVEDSPVKFSKSSPDHKFAASVAAFGMVLRDSPHKGNANLESALDWAKEGKGPDRHGYRQEFIRLIHRALSLSDVTP